MRHRPRRRPHPAPRRALRGHDDRGATLVIVIAVAVVGLLLGTTVAAVAVRSQTSAAQDRGRTQAVAAAEAGLDAAIVAVRDLDSDTQRDFACATTQQVWASPGASLVTVQYRFFVGSTPVACPLTNGNRVTAVKITATATYTAGSTTATRALSSRVALGQIAADSGDVFDAALFSDGSLASSASLTIGGGVYSNGSYACSADSRISGPLVLQGSFSASAPCHVDGDLLLGGAFSFSSSVLVGGRLTSAGASASAVSSPYARVLGPARVRSTVSGASSAVFPGGLTQNATPSPVAPELRQMPVVQYAAADWSSATLQTAAQWAAANKASGSACSPTAQTLRVPAGSTVVDATSCSPLKLGGVATIELAGDLTIFAAGVSSYSRLKAVSADGQPHTLRIIEPARGTDVCAVGGSGFLVDGGFEVDSRIRTFLYTPGQVRLTSPVTLNGAVYGCSASFSSNVTINYTTTPLPPVTGGQGTRYTSSSPTKSDVS